MNKYLRKSIHYFAGNLFNKILLIAFLPIFTHFMVPAEYAVYTNFLIFISFANLIYLMGMQQSIISYFNAGPSLEYKYTLISSMYILVFVAGVFFSPLILMNGKAITYLIVRDVGYKNLVPYIVVIIFAECIYGLTLSILNMMERSANYAVLGSIKNLILLILFLFGTFSNKFTVHTIFLFMMISASVASLLAIVNIIKILKNIAEGSFQPKIFSFKILRPVLKFGLFMIPGTMAMLILRVMDRYMLTYLSANGLHDAGIYATGYRIGMIMQLLATIVSLVFFPYAMRIADQPEAKKIYRKIYNYFIWLGSFLGILIILYSNEIFAIFIDSKYHEAINIVFVGVISVFLLGVFNILNIGFYIKKSAKNISIAVGFGAILNLVMNYFLIPKYGIMGAGIASIAAYLFIVSYNFIKVEKKINIGYNVNYLISSVVLLFALTYINLQIPSGLKFTIYKTLFFVVFLFAALLILQKNGKIEEFKIMYKNGMRK
ncbi:MAG: polysaccharide biosynthesis C-terminal domain-containing protein [Candidatus Cloacimonetes bacterium]|nr:polysaccharide biosynthesis C-terminal domain-containing protein [Candidatus Cloacimonadota bacterium]